MTLKKVSMLLFSLFVVGMFSVSVQAAEPIKIMLIEPMSGPVGPIGLMALDMHKYSADIVNQKGGLLGGRMIEIVPFDNGFSPEKAQQGLRKAIDEGIRYISQGVGSHITATLIKAVEKHNKRNPDKSILFLINSANATRFTEQDCGFWHFRFTQNQNMNAPALLEQIGRNPNIKKIYMYNQNYASGIDFRDEARKQIKLRAPQAKFVGDDLIPLQKTKDFTPYVAKVANSKADIVLTSAYGGDLVGFVRAVNAAGLNIEMYTIFASIPNYIVAIGVEGALRVKIKGLMNVNENDGSSTPETQAWIDGYTKKYKLSPFTTALKSVIDFFSGAIKKAGTADPKEVAFAMEGLELPTSNNDTRIMRASDHQILIPLAIVELDDKVPHKILAWGKQLGAGWRTVGWIPRAKNTLPTACKMVRPPR